MKRLNQIQKECQEEFTLDDPFVESVRREIDNRTKSLQGSVEEALKEVGDHMMDQEFFRTCDKQDITTKRIVQHQNRYHENVNRLCSFYIH